MLTHSFGNPISLPMLNHSILSSYQSNNVAVYHCVLDLLYTAYSWIYQRYID